MAKIAPKSIVTPLIPAFVGLIEHKVRRFNADVPGSLTADDLENPDLWVNVAPQFEMGTEIRCLADDMSFVANGICTYSQGSTAKVKIITMHELDQVDDDFGDSTGAFEIKLRGPKKWCVINKNNGDVIKEYIPTQLEALRELEDYKKALRA
jgi:hypothetical protein